jgi:RNA polymerase sigma-70 factor, ECF subfamily
VQIPPESAEEIELLHREMSAALERIAWAILRDWPLASDALQEAFVLLTEKWTEIPPENRRGWLVKTVQLTSHNLRRKQVRAQQFPEKLGLERRAELSERGSDARLREDECRQEKLAELSEALAGLPETQQQIVRMRLKEGLTFAQIAAQLGVPLGTVLSRMRLALEKLRRLLD